MRSGEFKFAREWMHRGRAYVPGEVASLPDCDIAMLAEAGAGDVCRPAVDDSERSRRKPKSPPNEPA